jgi:SAM-dependent methyltransferase
MPGMDTRHAAPESSAYLHGTAPEEQRRLSTLNALVNERSLRELALAGGERIVDFGAGLGQLTRDMARASGVRVVAIERSEEQIAEARRQAQAAGESSLIDLRAGDAASPPLESHEWGAFDLAHTRFLLEHLRDPLAVVRTMVRAVRPGGRIVLEDDDHDVLRLWPEPPGFAELWRAYIRTYDRLGNDPFIGRRLVSLLVEAGALPVRNTWVFFGACAGEECFPQFVENLIGVIATARAEILATGAIEGPAFDGTLDGLRRWGERPDSAIWFSISWAEGRKPE